jgi:hypothetical protein
MNQNVLSGLKDLLGIPAQAKYVHLVTMTINGVKHLYLGPVLPELFERGCDVEISAIEFGDLLEVEHAIRLLQGKYLEGENVN